MEKIEAVFFDLDGTLLDSALDFHYVLNQMLKERKRSPLSCAQVNQQVSNGARAMVKYAFNVDEHSAAFEQLKDEFLQRYQQALNSQSKLYNNVAQLLNFLDAKKILWGVVTNKPEQYTSEIMAHFALAHRACAVICPDHVSNAKPDPQGLLLACQRSAVNPKNAWYVGDHLRDIQAGKAAGMLSIGCQYGYLNANESALDWQADAVINDPIELQSLIQQHLANPAHL